jgi:two-component system, NarL family, response regulator LiaR
MKKITVLLADNHSLYREGTRSVIEHEPDIEVVGEASGSTETIRLVNELRPDIVLIDIAMPKLNGIQVTRRIKADCPQTAILVLTADDSDRNIVDLLEAGAAGYLLKNVNGADLINAIHAVHAGEAVLHPVIAQKIFNRPGVSESHLQHKTHESDLSEREMEILTLAASGMSNQDIAVRLYLSHRTVQAHLANIFRKMGVGSRTEAVLEVMKKGWLGLDDLP